MMDIETILSKYNIKPKKYMGQNFLIDESVLNKIVEAANLSPQDTVLEVGSGLGVLTAELTTKVKKVIAVEKDEKLCEILKDILKEFKNIEIINADILKMKTEKLPDYKIVANIPYYLTSPLIKRFLEIPNRPKSMILMVQKEVAQRICASPPDMSILAISVQFYAEPKIIIYVSKNSFKPVPKVDSAIIKIIPHKIPGINTKKFFDLVKRGFSAKRKILKNNLPELNLKKLGFNSKVRAENLSIDDWLKIFTALNCVDK